MAFLPWETKDQAKATKAQQQAQIDALQKQESQAWTDMNSIPEWDIWNRVAANEKWAKLNKEKTALNTEMTQIGPDGMPIAPEWKDLIDPATGQLRKEYQLQVGGINRGDLQGYNQFATEAQRAAGTDSAWAQAQKAKLGQEEAMAKDAAARQALSGQAGAESAMAMRGGMNTGARSLLALNAQKNLLGARQGVQQQGILNRLNVGVQDETNRQNQLQQLIGNEMNLGQFNKTLEGKQAEYNMNNLGREIEGRRSWEQQQWLTRMKDAAAGKQAEAIKQSDSGGK